MILYTSQGIVGERATPILGCELNKGVHSANCCPLMYPDGPLAVKGGEAGGERGEVVSAFTVTGQQEERKKLRKNKMRRDKQRCFSGRGEGQVR